MNRITIAAAAALMVLAGGTGACGGGGSNKTPTSSSAASTVTTTASASRTGTPPGGSTAITTSTPATMATLSVPEASSTDVAVNATDTAVAGEDITGGDPNATPHIVSTIPAAAPPSGTTPVVDSTAIAPPNPESAAIAFIIDMDASRAGIQASRDVSQGDVFQVGVVLVGVPPNQNSIGGIAALGFAVNYDKRKIFAPTYSGGPPTDRNPKLNLLGLGGAEVEWQCLPTPEGDLDDPGGIDGDGDPATGQAYISCFSPSGGPSSGTLVLATISFTAIASGSVELSLSDAVAADAVGIDFAHCADSGPGAVVPCTGATLNVR